MAYVAERYWAELHERADDERAVGFAYLPTAINRARYDVERRNVARALLHAGVETPRRVLDIGSGTGIWVDFWRLRGATEITGVDFAEVAVARLRGRYPEHRFLRCDICDPGDQLPQDMDIVSAMSVLLHVTDEERFEAALNNLLRCVRPGGTLVLVEPIVVRRWWGPPFGSTASSKARPLADFARILRAGGFEICALKPSTCLLTNPIDTKRFITYRLLSRYWHDLRRLVGGRERLGRAVAPVLRVLDLTATTVVEPGPAAKILVARRIQPDV